MAENKVKKNSNLRAKKEAVNEVKEVSKQQRKPKKQMSREDALKMLSDTGNELKQIIQDLKEDQMKLQCMPLKKVNDLINETLNNLNEDLEEINEKYEELKSLPEVLHLENK